MKNMVLQKRLIEERRVLDEEHGTVDVRPHGNLSIEVFDLSLRQNVQLLRATARRRRTIAILQMRQVRSGSLRHQMGVGWKGTRKRIDLIRLKVLKG